jgi:hypothetical protein
MNWVAINIVALVLIALFFPQLLLLGLLVAAAALWYGVLARRTERFVGRLGEDRPGPTGPHGLNT